MRWLLPLALVQFFSSCAETTSQTHILTQAKAEVSMREGWADRAFIRIEKEPRADYKMWKDFSWKVSAGAMDYSNFPEAHGIRIIPGTERELTFNREGCLTKYRHKIRPCKTHPYPSSEPTWTAK